MASPTVSQPTIHADLNTQTDGDPVGQISGSSSTANLAENLAYAGMVYTEDGSANAGSGMLRILSAHSYTGSNWCGKRYPFTSANLTGKLLAVGVSCKHSTVATNNSNLNDHATKANRGYVLRLYSNAGFTEYAEWVFAGSAGSYDSITDPNTSSPPWRVLVVDPADTTLMTNVSESYSVTTIQALEVRMTFLASGTEIRRSVNKIASTAGITLINGDSGTPGKFSDFYARQSASGVNIFFQARQASVQYFSLLPLQIGDGSTATRFEDSDIAIAFPTKQSSSANPWTYIFGDNKLGLTINLSASDYIRINRCLFYSATPWNLSVAGNSEADVVFTGGTYKNVGTNTLQRGTYTRASFSGCKRLELSGTASFSSCTISDSTDTTGALNLTNGNSIAGCSFTSNARAIAITASGTYNLSANTFTSNTQDFVVTAASGTVTINVDADTTTDKTWANTSAGATANGVDASGSGANVVFVFPTPTIQIEVKDSSGSALSGVNCAIYRNSDGSELLKELSDVSGIASASYTGGGSYPIAVTVRARLAGYVPQQLQAAIASTGLTVPITMSADGSYA